MTPEEVRLECVKIVSFSRVLTAIEVVTEATILETYIRGEDVTSDGGDPDEAPVDEVDVIVEAVASNVITLKPEWAAPAL